jgi:membrane protease YdiL (CAAX protease family)
MEFAMFRNKNQWIVFGLLLFTNAFLAFLLFVLGLQDQLTMGAEMPSELANVPAWQLGLANAGIILVLYGLLGVLGLWFANRLDLPGVFRENAGWRNWIVIPLAIGAVVGVVIVVMDRLFTALSPTWTGFEHPPFPASIIASATAGIGEEIIFRVFVMGLWAWLFFLILRRKSLSLWIGNWIGALAFAAGHLPSAMQIFGVSTPAEIPVVVLVELLLLNTFLGLVAGERYIKDGLVAAAGVHFWADIVWHVAFPLLAGG